MKTTSTSIQLHLAATFTAALAFYLACNYGSGWFIPVVCYLVAMVAGFTLLQRFGPLTHSQKIGLWWIQWIATPAFVTALWFGGKLTSMF